jgi:urea ABC transporter ATP-binding protein UrtE
MLLEVEGLAVGYGDSWICDGVSLSIDRGEVVCLLGRNGVGKTTLLRGLVGLPVAQRGRARLDGRVLSGLPGFVRARHGLAYVPQGRLVFPHLTVAENLRGGTPIGGRGRGFGGVDPAVFDYFPILRERRAQRAGTLSGGEQQMLAIGRALAGKPLLLLLDEPSEGIQPSIVQEIGRIVRRIAAERGLGILLVEQNLKFAAAAADRGYVMDKGRIVADGPVGLLEQDPVVREHLTFAEPAGHTGRKQP